MPEGTLLVELEKAKTHLIYLIEISIIAHVYYAYYFTNKIIAAVKKKLARKVFSLQKFSDPKQATALLTHNARSFSYLVIFAPNQLYYALLGTTLTFWMLKDIGGMILWLAKETKKDNFLIDKRDLIIKKNLVSSSLNSYNRLLDNSRSFANKRDLTFTLSWVIPSYSLGQVGGFIFLPFASEYLAAYQRIAKLSESTKKMAERLKEYPVGLAAQKCINNFLQQPERDDRQKNVLISEPITNISLQKVSFAYEKNKLILGKFDYEFKKGKINHLTGANGFGKSTVVSLIMGLYQPQKGEIIINNEYKLTDLNSLFANSENKEIFIFDEADNALDENNKKEFQIGVLPSEREKIMEEIQNLNNYNKTIEKGFKDGKIDAEVMVKLRKELNE
ncbi:12210_t:CDS:2 [Entrophospora sp. SA101]|nr:12210_t:CDS:2 [Entrophospora sp. SA101]